ESRIIKFIRDVVATGATLDMPHERKIAQGLIDYWVASAYGTKPQFLARAECLLLPYDATFIKSIAEGGDEALDALPRRDDECVHHILLGLIGGGFNGNFRPIEGDRTYAETILEKLEKVGVLSRTRRIDCDHFELRYEALIRQWDRLRT